MENFLIALGCVTPMFFILCVGLLIRRAHFVPDDVFHHLSTISFRVLLPFLLFYNLYSANLTSAVNPKLLLFLFVWVVIWFTLCYFFCTRRISNPKRRGAVIQAAFRSNIAVIGVSLAMNMMSADGLAMLAVAISMMTICFNIMAVITLESCRGGIVDLSHTLRSVIRNPLIIGCTLGFLCLLLGIHLPEPLERAAGNVGNAGSVCTMLALGASFEFKGLKNNAWVLVGCNLLRLVIAPLISISLAVALGFRGDALGTILICIGTPLATVSYPMALVYDSDHELTAQIVVTTSIVCTFTLFLWIFCLKQMGFM